MQPLHNVFTHRGSDRIHGYDDASSVELPTFGDPVGAQVPIPYHLQEGFGGVRSGLRPFQQYRRGGYAAVQR